MQFTDSEDPFFVTELEAGERLDKLLALRFNQMNSRTYFQNLIEQECVLLNGAPAKKRIRPKAGDEIEVHFQLAPELELLPEPIPLDIVFEDEYLIVINKPAGMVVHPAVGNWRGTFVNALLYHCQEQFRTVSKPSASDPASLRPGIVHRLDKDTSGLLIGAKTSLTQQRLVAMFASRQIHKVYEAICVGHSGTIEIKAPIGRHPVHRKLMAVRELGGKNAWTICRTLAFDGQLALVEFVLMTGRTHQIRVHMAHQGTPVLGDSTYGSSKANQKYGVGRHMLHAKTLRFTHPISGSLVHLEVPLPPDMSSLAKKIKLNTVNMNSAPRINT
jgi:23S rRNA pseudouridine1911/1915/1917 synthase